MNKKSILFIGLLSALLLTISLSFNSCNKIKKENPLIFYITNPFDFDVKITGHLNGCEWEEVDCVLGSGEERMYKASYSSGNIFVNNYETDKVVGGQNYKDNMHGTYTWVVGMNNSFVKVDDNYTGSNSGGGNNTGGSGNNTGQSIVFFSTGNIDECESVEVTVFKGFGSNGEKIDPIMKSYTGVVELPYDENIDVYCGMAGSATFYLPPGEYYYSHKTVNCQFPPYSHQYSWYTFTLEEGDCLKKRLTR